MPKEDKRDFDERFRTCYLDFALKIAAGLLLGSMTGGFFFRGFRRWPMIVGGGLGFGMAYSNCESSLNSFLLSMNPKVCLIKKGP